MEVGDSRTIQGRTMVCQGIRRGKEEMFARAPACLGKNGYRTLYLSPKVEQCKRFDVVEVEWEIASFVEQELLVCDLKGLPYPTRLSCSPGGQTYPPPLTIFTKYDLRVKKEFSIEGGKAIWKEKGQDGQQHSGSQESTHQAAS